MSIFKDSLFSQPIPRSKFIDSKLAKKRKHNEISQVSSTEVKSRVDQNLAGNYDFLHVNNIDQVQSLDYSMKSSIHQRAKKLIIISKRINLYLMK